jgi:hypothetical protein
LNSRLHNVKVSLRCGVDGKKKKKIGRKLGSKLKFLAETGSRKE